MKKVMITGVTSGLGYGLTKAYLNQGYQVYACARSLDKFNLKFENNSNLKPFCISITISNLDIFFLLNFINC